MQWRSLLPKKKIKPCHLQQKGANVENTRWVKNSKNGKTTACSLTHVEAEGGREWN